MPINIQKLRDRIRKRSEELNIRPAHDSEGHHYIFGSSEPYDSVTAHLQVLKDPGLMNRKMNRALEALEKKIIIEAMADEVGLRIPHAELRGWIEQAKLAPQQEFEGAGDIGTQVHNWREQWFNGRIQGPMILPDGSSAEYHPLPSLNAPLTVISACRAIEKFVSDTNYKPLACELYLADHKLQIGGTLDDIGLIGDSLVLIDLKTSNIGNKDSYYAQICLYLHMFRKLYRLYPQKVYILHTSKSNGTYELIPLHNRVDINATIRWAKQVVAVSQGLEIIKETKKRRTQKL